MNSLLKSMKSLSMVSKVALGLAGGASLYTSGASLLQQRVVYAEEAPAVCPYKPKTEQVKEVKSGVCPHKVPSDGDVCPHPAPTPVDGDEKVCPVKHDAIVVQDLSGLEVCPVKKEAAPAVCPVKHNVPTKSTPPVVSSNTDDAPAVCPMRDATGTASHGSYILGRVKKEPGNKGGDNYVKKSAAIVHEEDGLDYNKAKIEHADEIPGMPIPASGRGNSDDGAHWINPSPAQLFRALRRNKKIIDEEDAYSVAFIHGAVVDNTWDEIMKFEKLHEKECNDITLKKFQGMYGHHTLKSYFTHKINGMEPFDRHDWVVNRCGTEITYIIDYYAQTTAEGEVYSIDARPDMNRLGNIKDRLTLAFDRYKNGENIW